MRTNIEIDDKLMKEARKASKLKTKKAAVDAANIYRNCREKATPSENPTIA